MTASGRACWSRAVVFGCYRSWGGPFVVPAGQCAQLVTDLAHILLAAGRSCLRDAFRGPIYGSALRPGRRPGWSGRRASTGSPVYEAEVLAALRFCLGVLGADGQASDACDCQVGSDVAPFRRADHQQRGRRRAGVRLRRWTRRLATNRAAMSLKGRSLTKPRPPSEIAGQPDWTGG